MKDFDLDRQYVNRVRKDEVLAELRRVAAKLGNRRFSRREFDQHSERCKGTTVLKNFGTWDAAINAIGIELASHRTPRAQISDSQLLDELGRVWRMLGHRPSKGEWDSVDTKYSYTTYKQRFGGWLNACLVFVERSPTSGGGYTDVCKAPPRDVADKVDSQILANPRYVPLKLRLKVLQRDRFCCVMCGRSPALEVDVQLQIDHIVPFSRGGKTTIDNLQALCRECNLGKGDDQSFAGPV